MEGEGQWDQMSGGTWHDVCKLWLVFSSCIHWQHHPSNRVDGASLPCLASVLLIPIRPPFCLRSVSDCMGFFLEFIALVFLVSSSSFVLMQQTTTVLVDPLACERLHHLYDLGLYVISCRLLRQNASLGSILSTFTNTAQSLFQLITDNWYFSFSIGIELGGRVGVWVPSSYPKFNR